VTPLELRDEALALAGRYGDISDRLEALSADAAPEVLAKLVPELTRLEVVAEVLLAAAGGK
jgi:hypothetical protein